MIYFIADPHGSESYNGISRYLDLYRDGDLLIILGDLCLKFENTEENARFTEAFLKIDKPIALVEGNHENHPYLNAFPTEEWCGGRVNRLTPSIVRLQRGNIFEIDGKTFFVMGGCKSSAKWKERGLLYEGEVPSREELSLAYENFSRYNNRVDYILTHKYKPDFKSDDLMTLEGLIKYIDEQVCFTHWYAGHWHQDITYDARHTVVYEEPVALDPRDL